MAVYRSNDSYVFNAGKVTKDELVFRRTNLTVLGLLFVLALVLGNLLGSFDTFHRLRGCPFLLVYAPADRNRRRHLSTSGDVQQVVLSGAFTLAAVAVVLAVFYSFPDIGPNAQYGERSASATPLSLCLAASAVLLW